MANSPYSTFRSIAFCAGRPRAGLTEDMRADHVWGALMEMNMGGGALALLVSLVDGTTGGHSHEAVRTAASRLLTLANQYRGSMKRVEAFAAPNPGNASFFARTDSGVLVAEAQIAQLVRGGHSLSPLFQAGNAVITQLRRHAQSSQL
jgi:hypothetical protein